jgi:hypothetical protein
LPVGFSISKTWRLTLSFMAFPPGIVVLDAVERGGGAQLHTLCVARYASLRAFIPQREHCGKGGEAGTRPLEP